MVARSVGNRRWLTASTVTIAQASAVVTAHTPPTAASELDRLVAEGRLARPPRRILPEPSELGERLAAVMEVIYLVFNEGYAATAGDAWIRRELCAEAIRIPIAADQPSLNLAHAAQILTYELFTVALEHRSNARWRARP